MKVLFITVGTEGTASSRLRVFNYIPLMNAAGVGTRVMLVPTGKSVLRSRLWLTLLWPDVIFVQKALLSPVLRAALGATAKPRIYDLDDALFAVPAYMMPSDAERARIARLTNRMLRWADSVCVANSYLAAHASAFNSSVVTIPQSIDCSAYHPNGPGSGLAAVPVLGWVGAADARHFDNISLLVEPLTALARRRQFVLRIIGGRGDERFTQIFRDVPGIQLETVLWQPTAHHVPDEIRRLDVGLAPLAEDPFTLGKNHAKILEYMACGVLPVVSAVGMQKEFVQDGVNGFLVRTPEEWVTKLERALSGGPELDAMRKRAVEAVRTTYSIEVCGQRVLEMIVETARRNRDALTRDRRARYLGRSGTD